MSEKSKRKERKRKDGGDESSVIERKEKGGN